MHIINVVTLLLVFSAAFSYINYRFIRLPTTIGVMVVSMIFSIGLIFFSPFSGLLESEINSLLQTVRFDEAVLHGILGLLLFAGAFHINIADLRKQKWAIGLLATVSVLMSTFVVGVLTYWVLEFFDLTVSLIYCLLFGALISPTDPIAVLGILKQTRVPKPLETKIAGESLFNDGMAVVIFLLLLGLAQGEPNIDVSEVALLFAHETLGGLLLGVVLGILCFSMLKNIQESKVAVLITLATALGGYHFADLIHVSAPISVVIAGLFIGNKIRSQENNAEIRKYLDTFWELIDEILNAILFVLIGFEVLVIHFKMELILVSLLVIPIVLLARLVSVGFPIGLMRRYQQFSQGTVTVLTWTGLRGGVSIALALTLPLGESRDIIVAITYLVVIFSILVQGLSISRVIRTVIPSNTGHNESQ